MTQAEYVEKLRDENLQLQTFLNIIVYRVKNNKKITKQLLKAIDEILINNKGK